MNQAELDRGGRLVADPSITVYEDGHCFDFGRGGIYYKNIEALIKARPDLVGALSTDGSADSMASPARVSTGHDYKRVSDAAREMKPNITAEILDTYLPFYNYKLIHMNVGAIKGNLAAMMFRPTDRGAKIGVGYGLVQYRGDSRAKWMSVKGSDAKTVESMILYESAEEPVYVTFGMGDFLLLKSMGLNYLCFPGDNAAKNSPYVEYMKSKVGKRPIRLIHDNDKSGEATVGYLRSYGFRIEVFSWNRLGDLAEAKMDLRDLGWLVKEEGGTLDDLKELITDGDLYE